MLLAVNNDSISFMNWEFIIWTEVDIRLLTFFISLFKYLGGGLELSEGFRVRLCYSSCHKNRHAGSGELLLCGIFPFMFERINRKFKVVRSRKCYR
jgi:hypothetical protein